MDNMGMSGGMGRERKISILANLSDEALTRAMQANGISVDDDFSETLGPELAQGVESWSERDVSIPRSTRPQIANTDFLFIEGGPPGGAVDPFGGNPGEEEFYAGQQALGLEMF